MRELIAVMTCSKRPQYLRGVLEQLDAQAPELARAVFCDGPTDGLVDIPHPWWVVQTAPEPSGTRAAMYRLLVGSLQFTTPWDRLRLVEDDVQICRDWHRRCSAVDVPEDCAFVVGYDYRETLGEPEGLHTRPCLGRDGQGLWGQQTLLIPRRSVEFLASRPRLEWEREAPAWITEGPHACDAFIDWIWSRSPWPNRAIMVPQVVDHRGDDSAVGRTRIRRTWWFADDPRPVPCVLCARYPVSTDPLSAVDEHRVCRGCQRYRPRFDEHGQVIGAELGRWPAPKV